MDTMIPQRPLPSKEALKQFYMHKTLTEIPKPAAVLDLAIIKRHCNSMLQTIQTLGVGFRAHVKSHKVSSISISQTSRNQATLFPSKKKKNPP